MDDAQTIGARIRRARLAAGYDVAARFAAEVGVRPHSLWRYEAGHMRPGTDVLLAISRLTGVSIEWLATGTGRGPAECSTQAFATGTEG